VRRVLEPGSPSSAFLTRARPSSARCDLDYSLPSGQGRTSRDYAPTICRRRSFARHR
jgi:hypothetical protein